jgi:hypothetical protein
MPLKADVNEKGAFKLFSIEIHLLKKAAEPVDNTSKDSGFVSSPVESLSPRKALDSKAHHPSIGSYE